MTKLLPNRYAQSIRNVCCLLVTAILLLGFSQPSKAITIDFTSLATTIAPVHIIDGVIITGSNNVSVNYILGTGLGIAGGASNGYIDYQDAEFIELSFAAPAINLSYLSGHLGDALGVNGNGLFGERILEAFAVGGASLGSVSHNGFGNFGISASTGNVAITRFILSVDPNSTDFFSVSSITFDSVVSAVPVPAALPLFGTGLAIMGFFGWRRKRRLAV